MKRINATTVTGLMTMAFAALFANAANARCLGSKTPQLRPANSAMASALMRNQASIPRRLDPSDARVEPSIAGLWYVQFTAGGQVIDDGFDVWHSDGTELLNDSPAPSEGAVCVGVWTKTGPLTYTLKHPTWIFDNTGVNLIAIGVIREQVQLDPEGNTYTGSATLDLYDLVGNQLDHETSVISATRITPLDDPFATAPIPGLPAAIVRQ